MKNCDLVNPDSRISSFVTRQEEILSSILATISKRLCTVFVQFWRKFNLFDDLHCQKLCSSDKVACCIFCHKMHARNKA